MAAQPEGFKDRLEARGRSTSGAGAPRAGERPRTASSVQTRPSAGPPPKRATTAPALPPPPAALGTYDEDRFLSLEVRPPSD